MLSAITILSTKKLKPDHQQMLSAAGLAVHCQAFTRITLSTDLVFPARQMVDAIFTSINAVQAVIPFLSTLPVFGNIYCIAGRTELLLRDTFGDNVTYVPRPYAAELARAIVENNGGRDLWFFKGDRSMSTVPDALEKAGITLASFIVYNNELRPQKVSRTFDAILFFSPSAVESFCIDNIIPENTFTFAIGTTTGSALRGKAKHIYVAEHPSEKAVIEKVLQFFKFEKNEKRH